MKALRINLASLLKERNKTRYALSKEIDVSYEVITKYYRGLPTRFDKYVLLQFCTALNCNIGELLVVEEIPEQQ